MVAAVAGPVDITERVARLEAQLAGITHVIEVLRETQATAQDKFEENVSARFVQVKDLMASRRELEDALSASTSELRSRIDVGPAELRTLSRAIEDIRAEHVNRREFDEVKSRLDEGTGRRTAFIASLSVIIAIFAITFGVILKGGLTSRDVSAQIQTEAPWMSDRPRIEARISALERETERLKTRVAQLEANQRLILKQIGP